MLNTRTYHDELLEMWADEAANALDVLLSPPRTGSALNAYSVRWSQSTDHPGSLPLISEWLYYREENGPTEYQQEMEYAERFGLTS